MVECAEYDESSCVSLFLRCDLASPSALLQHRYLIVFFYGLQGKMRQKALHTLFQGTENLLENAQLLFCTRGETAVAQTYWDRN